jgi:hypothetical protein
MHRTVSITSTGIASRFLNHAIWYASTGFKRPYPGESKVLSPWAFANGNGTESGADDD